MFFTASKIFWLVAEPVSLAIFVGLLGIVLLFTRFARAGRALMAGAILRLASDCSRRWSAPDLAALGEPVSAAHRSTGRRRRNHRSRRRRGNGKIAKRADRCSLNADAARMTTGVELARRYPNARLVYTGGSALFRTRDRRRRSARGSSGSLWASRRANEFRGEIPQYLGKCRVDPRPCQAEARRDLAACDLGVAHAAFGRHLPPRRLPPSCLIRSLIARLAMNGISYLLYPRAKGYSCWISAFASGSASWPIG